MFALSSGNSKFRPTLTGRNISVFVVDGRTVSIEGITIMLAGFCLSWLAECSAVLAVNARFFGLHLCQTFWGDSLLYWACFQRRM